MSKKGKTSKEQPKRPADSTFEEDKKRLLNRIWTAVPRPLRIPIVVIVIVVSLLTATSKYWQPTLDKFLHPPPKHYYIYGFVYETTEAPLNDVIVELLNESGNVLSSSSDPYGMVTFNVVENFKVKSIRCALIDFSVDDEKLKQIGGFKLFTKLKKLEYSHEDH